MIKNLDFVGDTIRKCKWKLAKCYPDVWRLRSDLKLWTCDKRHTRCWLPRTQIVQIMKLFLYERWPIFYSLEIPTNLIDLFVLFQVSELHEHLIQNVFIHLWVVVSVNTKLSQYINIHRFMSAINVRNRLRSSVVQKKMFARRFLRCSFVMFTTLMGFVRTLHKERHNDTFRNISRGELTLYFRLLPSKFGKLEPRHNVRPSFIAVNL